MSPAFFPLSQILLHGPINFNQFNPLAPVKKHSTFLRVPGLGQQSAVDLFSNCGDDMVDISRLKSMTNTASGCNTRDESRSNTTARAATATSTLSLSDSQSHTLDSFVSSLSWGKRERREVEKRESCDPKYIKKQLLCGGLGGFVVEVSLSLKKI